MLNSTSTLSSISFSLSIIFLLANNSHITRNKTNNYSKFLEELYMTDNGNKFLYTEEQIKSKTIQKRYYYNNCGNLIRYIDESGRQFDY